MKRRYTRGETIDKLCSVGLTHVELDCDLVNESGCLLLAFVDTLSGTGERIFLLPMEADERVRGRIVDDLVKEMAT